VDRNVNATTQNQALFAVLFLYQVGRCLETTQIYTHLMTSRASAVKSPLDA
jgi:hypothetical protein